MKRITLLLLTVVAAAAAHDKQPNSPSNPSEPSPNQQVYRIGRDVSPPRVLFSPDPKYPPEASKGHPPAKIVLQMILGSDGLPRDVRVNQGISPELDEAAVEAVKNWRFQPATRYGKPVAVKIAIEVAFKPDQAK